MNKRLFAIGDIHGCFDAFRTLIEQKIRLKKSDKIVLLGDYIDRGTQSKEVVDYIFELQNSGFDVIPIMGNHESRLLDAYDNDIYLPKWLQTGGIEALQSFGIKSLQEIEPLYIEFFKGLRYYFLHENYIFVHAGFNDEIDNPFTDKNYMINECREKYEHPSLKDKTIVHAHSPISESLCKENLQTNTHVINIDTGCIYAERPGCGKLSAIELYNRVLFSV
jgi:serine/threonine protein phosphatase 1